MAISSEPPKDAENERPGRRLLARRALIVEDETLVAWHLELVLQDLGFELCEIATSGGEAIERAVTTAPDIVFMDVNLAGEIDGVEAAKRICEKSDVAIIFVTAYADDQPTIMKIRSTFGSSAIVGKPATPAAIQAAMRQLEGGKG